MKITIISLVVIAVLGIGGYLLFNNSELEQASTNNTENINNSGNQNSTSTVSGSDNSQFAENATITYTDAGYVPGTVTVKKGDTVRFVNNSSKAFWPASAVHPTHEIYPEFDAKTSIGTGESWFFTFDNLGSWKYHDHLDPSKRGTVVVAE